MEVKHNRSRSNRVVNPETFRSAAPIPEEQVEARRQAYQVRRMIKDYGCRLCCAVICSATPDGSRIACARLQKKYSTEEEVAECRVPDLYADAFDGKITEITKEVVWAAMPLALVRERKIPYVDTAEILAEDDMKPVNQELPDSVAPDDGAADQV